MQSNNSKTYELVLTALFVAIIVVMASTPLGYIPLVVINATTLHIPVIIGSLFLGPKKGGFLGGVFGITSFIKSSLTPTPSAFAFSPVAALTMLPHDTVGEAIALVFKSTFIAIVPRILIGVVPYFVYVGIKKAISSEKKFVYGSIINAVISFIMGFGVFAFFNKMISEGKVGFSVTVAQIIGVVVGIAAFTAIEYLFMNKDAKALGFITAGISGAMTNTLLVMGSIYIFYKDPYAEVLQIDPSALMAVIGGIISFNGVIEAIVGAVIVYLVGIVLDKIKPAGVYAGKSAKIKAVEVETSTQKMAN
ncbi:ECF transporter S component [Pseudobutyrivibrio xylanivorans]|uniref:ECF transporter S component n=1 Tax=Pseudobutyrivibrio xylanivorans TaxID=185007 RepID=A0A5P6VTE0_PSEXY|nr:ECF transporter S component [Pseudobutyrivibrio xylanivorans]QFJ55019.1 ECF transporter S component [Pseudobutyrivibrio xylanivorans]